MFGVCAQFRYHPSDVVLSLLPLDPAIFGHRVFVVSAVAAAATLMPNTIRLFRYAPGRQFIENERQFYVLCARVCASVR